MDSVRLRWPMTFFSAYVGTPYKWQKEMGYNKRSLIETAMMRYKKLIGDKLYSRNFPSQRVEAKVGCLVLNKMLAMGKPTSLKVA